MQGLELARRFYAEAVRPLMDDIEHSAALLGWGSEVLGFDDVISTDHNYGPRLQIFLPDGLDPAPVHAALAGLPERFAGFSVHYTESDTPGAQPRHHIEVTTLSAYCRERIGANPAAGMSLADWLLTPTQEFATLTAGAVFADPDGDLARRREALRWYPADVWRYVLAAGWLRIAQEEAFIGRTGAIGDELGSSILAARLVRDQMRLAFLIERRWAPYNKWLGTAFARLELAERLGPHFKTALGGQDWREREAAVCAASAELATATNALGLAEELDPAPRPYFGRDIQVIDAGRFAEALSAAVADPQLHALIEGQGLRHGGLARLPGSIDQATDNTDVLSSLERCRASAELLGLENSSQVI